MNSVSFQVCGSKKDNFLTLYAITPIHPFWPCPRVKTHTPGDMKIKISVEDFLVNIIISQFLIQMCENREENVITVYALTLYCLPPHVLNP